MRLGADPIKLHPDTRAREIYGEAVVYERHRHRYEVSISLRKRLEAAGLVVSGTSPDERLVEVIELRDHPFFVASQFHPEFKSRPERPAPLFREFVAAALERARDRHAGAPPGRTQDVTRRGARRHASPSVRPGLRGRAPAAERRCSPSCARSRARSGASARWATAWPASCARSARGHRGRRGRRDRRRMRQPARAHPRPGGAVACCCAPTSTPSRTAARRAGVSSTAAGRAPATTILGADNKAAVAVLLALARRAARRGRAGGHRARSSRSARRTRWRAPRRSTPRVLRCDFGYVFDHASPIGEIVVASPTYYRLTPSLPRGRPRTPGSAPRTGAARSWPPRSAIAGMRLGRLDDETTANVGTIARRRGRRRTSCPSTAGSTPRRARCAMSSVEAVVAEMVDHCHDAANDPACECDVDVTVERLFAATATRPARRASSPRRARAARLRLHAAADRHRRRLGRQRVRGQGLCLHEPRQRHRAQPRAGRARQPGRAGGDARRDLRAARRAGRVGAARSRSTPAGECVRLAP